MRGGEIFYEQFDLWLWPLPPAEPFELGWSGRWAVST
jgi:hypothetical protein